MLAICALAVALLAGCNPDGVEYHYDYVVTFDYNVDNLGVATTCETQYIGINDGDKLEEPGSDKVPDFKAYVVQGFTNEGWYTAVLDGEGNPKKDNQGNIILDKKWDFEQDVVKQDMTLYAHFTKNASLTVVVEGGDNIVITKPSGTSYRPLSVDKPEREGYTFIDYYTDNTYTTKFEFPYVFTDEDATCYAYMIEGDWEIITTREKFRTALASNSNMYFDVPGGELDFNRFIVNCYAKYDGKIYGNGCVLKNITITQTYKKGTETYSLFGNIGSKAEFKDISFENLTLNMTVTDSKADLQVALFATNIDSGAKFEDVKFTNCALNYIGHSDFNYETYGYYVTSATTYSCFDNSELTVKQNGVVIVSD